MPHAHGRSSGAVREVAVSGRDDSSGQLEQRADADRQKKDDGGDDASDG